MLAFFVSNESIDGRNFGNFQKSLDSEKIEDIFLCAWQSSIVV
jgi:hypothetical protein